jgi:hypothetical protein
MTGDREEEALAKMIEARLTEPDPARLARISAYEEAMAKLTKMLERTKRYGQ